MALQKSDIDRFMSELRVKLTGASDAGLKLEFWSVLKEFFDTSDSWTETIDIPIVVGVQDYLLVPQHGGKIIKLTGVSDHQWGTIPAFMPEFGKLHLRWKPSNSQVNNQNVVYHVHVVKTLLDETQDGYPIAPSWILTVYYKVMLDGLLGRMMQQENKSYSNAQQGQYHLRQFLKGCQDAKVASQRQNTRMAQNWRFPGTARATSSQRGYGVTEFPPENWI